MKKILSTLVLATLAFAVMAQVDTNLIEDTRSFIDRISSPDLSSKEALFTFVYSVVTGILTSELFKMFPIYGKVQKYIGYISFVVAIVVVSIVFGLDINFIWSVFLAVVVGQGFYQFKKANAQHNEAA
ncbi:MAG: hypothetical protein D6746_08635 [Bacteroidetes bacterium]|nr:MAG: hypothetical protein D6746_08635 [Bacteroidota bacterium]